MHIFASLVYAPGTFAGRLAKALATAAPSIKNQRRSAQRVICIEKYTIARWRIGQMAAIIRCTSPSKSYRKKRTRYVLEIPERDDKYRLSMAYAAKSTTTLLENITPDKLWQGT